MINIMTFRRADMVYYLFGIFLFSSTFSIAMSQSALGLALFLLLISRFRGFDLDCFCIRPLHYFFIAVGLYIIWMIVACLFGGSILFSLNNMREEWLFLIIPVTLYLSQDKERFHKLIFILALGVIAVSLSSFYKFISVLRASTIEHGDVEGFDRIIGSFSNPLTFGNYLAVASGFILAYMLLMPERMKRSNKWFFMISGILGGLATLLTASRGPIISLAVGLLLITLLVIRKRRYLSILLLSGMVLTIVFTPSIRVQFTDNIEKHLQADWPSSRLYVWSKSFEIARENPVVGVGPGNFINAYIEKIPEDLPGVWQFTHAHNDLLNVSAVAGFPGFFLFLFLWLTVLKLIYSGYKQSDLDSVEKQLAGAAIVGSLIFFVGSMSEATFVDEEVRALLMFIWAVGLSVWYTKSKTGGKYDKINP